MRSKIDAMVSSRKFALWMTLCFYWFFGSAAVAAEMSSKILKSLPAVQGTVTLPEKTPDFIVVDFWASWCAPCLESGPFLEEQKKIWKNENILRIGVNEDKEVTEARNFLKEHKSNLIQLWDSEKKLAHSLDLDSLPRLYVLNSRYEILWTERGFTSEKKKQFEKQFRTLFGSP